MQYSVIDTPGRARRTVDIEVAGSPMMHDFSLTDKYVVLYDLPVTFDPVQMVPTNVPRWLNLPARLVVQSLIGRVRIPSPITMMINRDRRPIHRMPYSWDRDYPRASEEMSTALDKHDYAKGSSMTAVLGPDLLIGEMSFVPQPTASEEGYPENNGILIGYGYCRSRDQGQLLLLDAETLESMATVHLPQRVPMGFHGNWAPTVR